MSDDDRVLDRRRFIRLSSAAVAGGTGLLRMLESAEAAPGPDDGLIRRNHRASMTYRRLGDTRFLASRLAFGCGAALSGGRAVRLLDHAFEAGINYYDTGRPYGDSESQLAPFLKAHGDEVWVTSKAAHMGWPDKRVGPDDGNALAELYTSQLDESLLALGTDYVDAYLIMGIDDEKYVRNEDLYGAFLKAKQAGKVGHYGLTTHANAQQVLEAAVDTGWYDLAMVAVTPAGWYDYSSGAPSADEPNLSELAPTLQQAKAAGIGLIAMKVARMIGADNGTVFDGLYDEDLRAAPLSACQRAYTYVLGNGLDIANSHMPNTEILEENLQVVMA